MTTRTILTLALASFATAACTTDDDTQAPRTKELTVRHTTDMVEGSFTENGATIDFRITRMGRDNSVVITTRDGFKLVESITTDGIESAMLLESFPAAVDKANAGAGRFTPTAVRDLEAMPELEAMHDLPKVLTDRGIDISVFINSSPALGQVLCPTRTAVDPVNQTDTFGASNY